MDHPAQRASFSEVHDRHRERIFGYLHRMTRDLSLAEDLTQDTFLRASRGLPDFKGNSKLSTWLYRIATNVYLDHRRREVRRAESAETAPGHPGLPGSGSAVSQQPKLPDRLFEESQMGACIREYVDGLRPDYRAVIILHDLQGLTNPEIARVLGCSVEAVKIRIHRARGKLRAVLTEHCDLEVSDENVLQCDRKQPGELEPERS
jgi:RNA polymerase sigma-70 factor (ECF subfamily)